MGTTITHLAQAWRATRLGFNTENSHASREQRKDFWAVLDIIKIKRSISIQNAEHASSSVYSPWRRRYCLG